MLQPIPSILIVTAASVITPKEDFEVARIHLGNRDGTGDGEKNYQVPEVLLKWTQISAELIDQ